ncbi:hypothetical protein EMCRGX_G014680 [Ephydatia muelleri]
MCADENEDLVEKPAYLYLFDGRYPEGSTSNDKRVIRRKAATLTLRDGEVFYKKPKKNSTGQKISTCDLCQRNSQKLSISTPELFPVPVHSPWHHVGIDFVGPISPKTTSGNSYILTLCDYFTKWVEAVALPTKEASGIASSLFKETEIQQKESQHKALLEEVQKNIISAQKKQKEQYDKKHSASTSRSAVSLSPTKDETTLALSPTGKDSASAVLQEREMGLDPNDTKTKLVAKLMRQNSKKITVPYQPAIEVESYVPLAQDEVQHWVPGLTTEDKKMITSGGWLSDEIVDAGQKLLKSTYPNIQGLQEVALYMVLSYSIAKSEFIQIMNTGKHHWVIVSNINCNDEEIHVYDCASGSPTSFLLNQIASIVCTPKDIIKLTYIDVQMQQGCDDCGLFAIAFATSLARGEQPGSFFYKQKAMRKHLITQKKKITAFPIKKIRRHGSKVRHSSKYTNTLCLQIAKIGRN